jgi:hypothetical protein
MRELVSARKDVSWVGEIRERGMDYQLLCMAAGCSECSMLDL